MIDDSPANRGALIQLHEDLWVMERPLRFFGLEIGTRMTVVRIGGELLLHSPVAPDDTVRQALADLGRVRWVLGPNKFHHLYLAPWMALGAEAWAGEGLRQKRSDLAFAGTVGSDGPWSKVLDQHRLVSLPFTDESVFLHKPSRTLVVSDLLFNLRADAPWLPRTIFWATGGYPGVCCSVLERALMKRELARKDLARILQWDFDQVVLAHGAVVTEGGHDGLRQAYSWLGPEVSQPHPH